MKQVLYIFFCFMSSFGHAREDPLLQEDGTNDSHQESRQFKAPGILGNLKSKYEVLAAELKYPYIDEKCCNLSTTYDCSRMGSDGFRGHCMPRNETCLGREFFGTRYCVISKHQSCKCCVPTDCLKQSLAPCTKLNGTCIGLNDHCNGTSVVSEEFCKKNSRKDTCKCCFPLVPEADCPCGQDYEGHCVGSASNGRKEKGRCMKTCDRGTVPLRDNTCNTTGGNDCKCCARNVCGRLCNYPNPTSCICMTNGASCPKGYCPNPNADICPHDGCNCCKDQPSDCRSQLEQCSAPKDYCVDKLSGDCPKGLSKVFNACSNEKEDASKGKRITHLGDGVSNKYAEVSKSKDCDCCKSTECSSIGDRCTGRGSFCINHALMKCPFGYAESLDCSKPLIKNGTIVGTAKCKCCKPKSVECSIGCFRIGSQCFMRTHTTSHIKAAEEMCAKNTQKLAEPQDPQALSQYLATNYPDEATYWIGARGTNNDNAAWLSGGVIGPNAPWFANWYATCDNPNWCMYLQANPGCYISNQCLGCWKCTGSNTKRSTLCSCDKSLYE